MVAYYVIRIFMHMQQVVRWKLHNSINTRTVARRPYILGACKPLQVAVHFYHKQAKLKNTVFKMYFDIIFIMVVS